MQIAATITYRCSTCGELIEDGRAVLIDPEGNIVDPDGPLPAGTTSHHAAHIEELNNGE